MRYAATLVSSLEADKVVARKEGMVTRGRSKAEAQC